MCMFALMKLSGTIQTVIQGILRPSISIHHHSVRFKFRYEKSLTIKGEVSGLDHIELFQGIILVVGVPDIA